MASNSQGDTLVERADARRRAARPPVVRTTIRVQAHQPRLCVYLDVKAHRRAHVWMAREVRGES